MNLPMDWNGVLRLRKMPILPTLLAFFLLGYSYAQAQSDSVIYDGFTEPWADIMISGHDLGRIESIHVKMGNYVHDGQLLAQIDDSLQQSNLRISRAQAEMSGEIDLAEAEAEVAKTRRDKLRQLVRDRLARPDELQRAESDYASAAAQVTIAKEQQRLRNMQVERDVLQVGRKRLTAPQAGLIARVLHSEGEFLTPADPALFRLIVVDTLQAVFNINVEHVERLHVGDQVQVHLRSHAQTVVGTVDQISPSIDGESGTIQVRVAIQNPGRIYRAGDRCSMQVAAAGDRQPRSAAMRKSIPSRETIRSGLVSSEAATARSQSDRIQRTSKPELSSNTIDAADMDSRSQRMPS
ncbi:MAG: efflux RND transporter periplasmic adaptor subunit, partial [Planctomycetota bacterium]